MVNITQMQPAEIPNLIEDAFRRILNKSHINEADAISAQLQTCAMFENTPAIKNGPSLFCVGSPTSVIAGYISPRNPGRRPEISAHGKRASCFTPKRSRRRASDDERTPAFSEVLRDSEALGPPACAWPQHHLGSSLMRARQYALLSEGIGKHGLWGRMAPCSPTRDSAEPESRVSRIPATTKLPLWPKPQSKAASPKFRLSPPSCPAARSSRR